MNFGLHQISRLHGKLLLPGNVYKGAGSSTNVENEDFKGVLQSNAKVTVLSTCADYYCIRRTDGGAFGDGMDSGFTAKNSEQWDATGQQPALQTPKPTKAPDIRVKALNHKRIQISWDKKAGAKSYEIRRSTKKNGKYKTIGKVGKKKRKYVDKTPKYRKKYYYQVRARKKNKKVTYTSKAWGRTAKKNIKKTNLAAVEYAVGVQ